MYSNGELMLKRLFDCAAAAAGLVTLAPVLVATSLAVRASSPGPVLFRQRRVGRGGRPFSMVKFRTMRVHNEGSKVTASGDGRITPIGRVLRVSKLDELPELLNVLAGDMSLVGPRPEVPEYVAHYKPEWRKVLDVRPGLTDPATIRFRNEEAELAGVADKERYYTEEILPEKLALNLEYLQQASFLRDMTIIARTFFAIVRTGRAGR